MDGVVGDVAENASRECGGFTPDSLGDFLGHAASRGFDVSNEPLASELFEHVGCQRLLRYMAFIEEHGIEGSARSLEGLSDLLAFDASMRNLILKYIDMLETQLKARYAQCMFEEHGEYCLADKSNFRNPADYHEAIRVVKSELNRWKGEGAIGRRAYRDFEGIPIWTALEACSFNTVSRLLKNTQSAKVVDSVAGSFGVNKRCLISWMKAIGHVRNICAHFAPFAVCEQIPSEPKSVLGAAGDHTSPLYILVIIGRLLQGRANGGRPEAMRDLARFRRDARLLVGQFAEKHSDMVAALRVPPEYAARRLSPVPHGCFAGIGEPSVEYAVIALAA